MDTDDGQLKDGLVTFQSRQELEVRGTLLHLTRYAASFEIYGPEPVVRISEALEDFRIYSRDEPVYAGRAIVQHAVNTGTATICSVVLDDYSFDARVSAVAGQNVPLGSGFDDFVRGWQKVCKVLPEFKVAVADIRTFLVDCRRWMEQVELGIRSSPKSDLAAQERGVIDELSPRLVTLLDDLFERFEIRAARLDDDQRPVHRSYIQRHLHPIVLCAPFAYRSYRKPLGYAGDYEVVNMMLRDPQEGSSLFAKMFNVWLLHQASAAAHRNRIEFLKRRLIEETAAAVRAGRTVRIFSLGCGPAREVQDFLAESELSNHAQFTLVDFNEETLQHAVQAVSQKRREFGRSTSFETARKSVQQLLKDMLRAGGLSRNKDYDFIYCAGLFDYLPDRTCRRLLELFYQSLAPGGLVLATNIAPFSPNRGSLELILDWHLIYRDARGVAALLPDGLPDDAMKIQSDSTGVNVFFEARKNHGV